MQQEHKVGGKAIGHVAGLISLQANKNDAAQFNAARASVGACAQLPETLATSAAWY
jgi:hypothetical protein